MSVIVAVRDLKASAFVHPHLQVSDGVRIVLFRMRFWTRIPLSLPIRRTISCFIAAISMIVLASSLPL